MIDKNQKGKKTYKLRSKRDFLYNSYWMEKFINKFMRAGKKEIVEKTIFCAFQKIKRKTNLNTFYFFLNVLVKFRPIFGFISKRLGKQFKKVPVPLYPRRQTIVSLKWLTTSILLSPYSSFELRLRHEFLDLNARKKTALWRRYADYISEVHANRLNQRFRWK
jgi:ribosomal protein S7